MPPSAHRPAQAQAHSQAAAKHAGEVSRLKEERKRSKRQSEG